MLRDPISSREVLRAPPLPVDHNGVRYSSTGVIRLWVVHNPRESSKRKEYVLAKSPRLFAKISPGAGPGSADTRTLRPRVPEGTYVRQTRNAEAYRGDSWGVLLVNTFDISICQTVKFLLVACWILVFLFCYPHTSIALLGVLQLSVHYHIVVTCHDTSN